MRAMDLRNRKIKARVDGEVGNYFVKDMKVIDGVPKFIMYNINSIKKVINASDLTEWQFVDTKREADARNLSELVKTFDDMNADKSIDMVRETYEDFERAKRDLADERRTRCNHGRMHYHDDSLSVFYDIYHGHTVQGFKTLEEIESMKKRFDKPDPFRKHQPLMSLQAFDKDGNLVIDEWYR